MGRVTGKVAIITGGASGLGRADAELLLAEGASVVITDVNVKMGAELAERLGGKVLFLEQDVRDEARWQAVIAETVRHFGRLDILVNNAGVVVMATPEDTTLEQFRFANQVMSEGVFLGCKHAIPAMKATGGGAIVNMSSTASHLGFPIFFAYSAAKGAVRSMTKAVAVHCQMNGYKIRCNSVHPGAIETPMVQKAEGRETAVTIPEGVLPLNSSGTPKDVAQMVLYLASDESRFVTGAEFLIDNGLTINP